LHSTPQREAILALSLPLSKKYLLSNAGRHYAYLIALQIDPSGVLSDKALALTLGFLKKLPLFRPEIEVWRCVCNSEALRKAREVPE
jgi:hypothetical protein